MGDMCDPVDASPGAPHGRVRVARCGDGIRVFGRGPHTRLRARIMAVLAVVSASTVLVIAGGWSSAASAENVGVWVGPGEGDWSNANNWECLVHGTLIYPCPLGAASGFTVNIDNTSAILNMNANPSSLALGVSPYGTSPSPSGGGLVAGNGNGLAVSGQVDVGVSLPGNSLQIVNGGVVGDQSATVGLAGDSAGAVTVSGAGSQWNTSGELDVGVNGQGALTVDEGARVTGGSASQDQSVFIGGGSGSLGGTGGAGTVAVTGRASDGTPSRLTVVGGGCPSNAPCTGGILFVGWPGRGTLTISDGGRVDDAQGVVSNSLGAVGTVTVTGPGSVWNNSQLVYVGSANGHGALTISDGGVVTDPLGGVGIGPLAGSESVGRVAVTGAGARWNNSQGVLVGFGSGSNGTLTISNGGAVSSAAGSSQTGSSGELGGTQGSTGTVVVTGAGSHWDQDGGMRVGFQGAGSLIIADGGVVNDAAGSVGFEAGSSGSVLVTGAGSAWHNSQSLDVGTAGAGTLTVEDGGVVSAGTSTSPGPIAIGALGTVHASGGTLQGNVIDKGVLDPVGPITVVGNFTESPQGMLLLDVAGTGPGQVGQLDVSGVGTFAGTIDVDFIDGFAPRIGDTFDLIDAAGGADFTPAAVDVFGLEPGFQWTNDFSNSNGTFQLIADTNGVSAVPEPSTLVLCGTGLASLVTVRRRRRGRGAA